MNLALLTLLTLAREALPHVPPGEHAPRHTLYTIERYLAGALPVRDLDKAIGQAHSAHLSHARKANKAKKQRRPWEYDVEFAASKACFLAWKAGLAARGANVASVGPVTFLPAGRLTPLPATGPTTGTTPEDHAAVGRAPVARLLFSVSGAFGAVAMILMGQRPVVALFLAASAVVSVLAAIVAMKGP